MRLSYEIDHRRGNLRRSLWSSTSPEESRGGVFCSADLNARSKSLIESCVFARRISSRLICSSLGPTTSQLRTQARKRSVSDISIAIELGSSLRYFALIPVTKDLSEVVANLNFAARFLFSRRREFVATTQASSNFSPYCGTSICQPNRS